jgi:hypothetical protein
MTFNNCLTDFLLSAFKVPNTIAVEVVDILSAQDSIEEKVKRLQTYEISKIVSAVVAIGLAAVHIEVTNGVSEIVKNKQERLEELNNLKDIELAELILSLSTVMHAKSDKIHPFSLLLLLIPLLLSTKLFTIDSISDILVNIISTNNISIVDIVECAHNISTAFSLCAETPASNNYLSIN